MKDLVEHHLESGFYLGDQHIEPARCAILTSEGEIRIEPRVMDVLALMVAHAGQVVTREEFIKAVWNGTFVTDEVLSRCIYRLRKALGDDTRSPQFIETVAKRGYRLIAPVRFPPVVAESAPRSADPPMGPITQQRLIPVQDRHDRTTWKPRYWILPAAAVCLSVVVYLFHIAGGPRQAVRADVHAVRAGNAASLHQETAETRNSIAILPFVNMSGSPENDYFCDGISEETVPAPASPELAPPAEFD